MNEKSQQLLQVLEEMIQVLEDTGETHWAKWMLEAKILLKESNSFAVEHLLAAYGGMGSFSDLVITQKVEHSGGKQGKIDQRINDRLSKLRSTAWELADAIWREQIRSNS